MLTCWVILSSYIVGLGLHNLEGSQEPGSRMLEAHLSIQHPNFNDPSFANDLMLIKLNESVMESNTIRRIPVATQCPTPGDTCLVSGWGRLKNGELPGTGLPSLRSSLPLSQNGLALHCVPQGNCPASCSV